MLPINEILEKINTKEKRDISPGECFLSLVIGERQVQAALWNFSVDGGQARTYGSWESWGGESTEELIVAADVSIASAIASMPDVSEKQPTQVILGLPNFWVEENAIKKEKLEVLQIVCKKLLLKPLGFVVTPEAIAHFLKKTEGGSASLILVDIDESEITVSLIIQGKFLGSKIVGRSNSLALDLEEGLLRFNFENALPVRILLLGGKPLEEEKQALISYPWVTPDSEKKLSFLQFPKVDVAEDNFETSAVILAGSHELGGEVKKELSMEPEAMVEPEVLTEGLDGENFKFIKGGDILTVNPPQEPVEEKSLLEEEPKELPEQKKEIPLPVKTFFTPGVFRKFRFPLGIKRLLARLGNIFESLFQRGFLIGGVALIIFLGTVLLLFTKIARSEVKLLVQAQRIEKEFEFTVLAGANSVDSERMTLPGREISVEVSGKKSSEVKGKKTVGDKAKGEIAIYNGTDKTKTLVKGTSFKGPGGLKFIISSEAIIPAKTTDLNATPPIDKWGEKKISAEAADIGAQYNIAANSNLILESLPSSSSSFLVKNSTAFSGGTSREIQAVSKEDRDSLVKEITKDLEGRANEEIKSKISVGDHLLEDSIQLKSKVDQFDGEVGDEASTLSVEGKYVFSTLYFKEDDLKILVDRLVLPLIQEGYQKQPTKQEESFSLKDKSKGIYKALVKEDFLPNIDVDKVAQELKAKRFSAGEAYLRTLPKVVGMETSFQPKFFSLLKFFPLNKQNITVKVEAL